MICALSLSDGLVRWFRYRSVFLVDRAIELGGRVQLITVHWAVTWYAGHLVERWIELLSLVTYWTSADCGRIRTGLDSGPLIASERV